MRSLLRDLLSVFKASGDQPSYGYRFSEPAPRLCQLCIDLYGIEAVMNDAITGGEE